MFITNNLILFTTRKPKKLKHYNKLMMYNKGAVLFCNVSITYVTFVQTHTVGHS